MNVPLKYDETTLEVGRNCTPPGKIAAFRGLFRDAKMGGVQIAEDVSEVTSSAAHLSCLNINYLSKYIQSDFVLERQRDKETTPDDLISWLNISR